MLRRLKDDAFDKKVEDIKNERIMHQKVDDNTFNKLEDNASIHLLCINH